MKIIRGSMIPRSGVVRAFKTVLRQCTTRIAHLASNWLPCQRNCCREQLSIEPLDTHCCTHDETEMVHVETPALEHLNEHGSIDAIEEEEVIDHENQHSFAPPDGHEPEPPFGSQYELSESAQRELRRLEERKSEHIARSFGNLTAIKEEDTGMVDEWRCSNTSLLSVTNSVTQELSVVDRLMPTTETHAKEKPEEPQKPVTPAIKRPGFFSSLNPFRHYSETALILLAQNPSTDRPALLWLSLHPSPDIRCAVSRNPNCPAEALLVLARDGEAGIRHAIADNPRSTMQVLEMLAIDKNPLIAWRAQNSMNIAKGKRTVTNLKPAPSKTRPAEMVRTGSYRLPYSEELAATDETIAFLKLIARKTNTPARRLAELVKHPDSRVRAAVAENANAPVELLWVLAKDEEQEVKLKLIENYNCPLEILEALKDDPDSYVSWQAKSVLHRLSNEVQPNPFIADSSTKIKAVTSRDLP